MKTEVYFCSPHKFKPVYLACVKPFEFDMLALVHQNHLECLLNQFAGPMLQFLTLKSEMGPEIS